MTDAPKTTAGRTIYVRRNAKHGTWVWGVKGETFTFDGFKSERAARDHAQSWLGKNPAKEVATNA